MFRLIIVLTTISLIAAISLAMVYDITRGPIAEQEHLKTIKGLKAVLPEFNNDIERDSKDVVVGSGKNGKDLTMKFYKGKLNNRTVGTAFQVVAPDGYAGDINILMGVTPDGRVSGIEIISHKETPGLGSRVEKKEWRDAFRGKSLEDSTGLAVKKDGGDIDQFSGATISPRAVVSAVKKGLQIYRKEFANGG